MMVIVVEPGQRSIQTAQTIRRLAQDVKIPRLGVVMNKVPKDMDTRILIDQLEGLPVLGKLSFDPDIARADLEGCSPFTASVLQKKEIRAILKAIEGTQ